MSAHLFVLTRSRVCSTIPSIRIAAQRDFHTRDPHRILGQCRYLRRKKSQHLSARHSPSLSPFTAAHHEDHVSPLKSNHPKHQKGKDPSFICNHHLQGLHFQQNSVANNIAGSLAQCGQCNVLGWNSEKHSDFDNQVSSKQLFSDSQKNIQQSLGFKYVCGSGLSRYSSVLSSSAQDTNWAVLRSLHTSIPRRKEESIAEKTVKQLKDEAKKSETLAAAEPVAEPAQTVIAPTKPTPRAPTSSPVSATPAAEPVTAIDEPKKSLWKRFVAEVKHYYHGFRLLGVDVRVCLRHLWKVLNGKSLTRRERRQLVRTTSDLFRLVPFMVFIVVPFMEFLLPVALKLFPNMLPSTFMEADKQKEKMRKKLKSKLEMAKFLQDTLEETALQRKGAKGETTHAFVNFMHQIRTSGTQASNEAIMKYSKLFEDDFTLDNLNYGQLRALSKLLDLPTTVATSNFLRFQLRLALRQLEADDRMIQKETVDSLAVWELQDACRARGMRALGVPEARLKSQLSQWLDLHLNENIPTSLLLLSRTLFLPEQLSTEEQLAATISTLPETTTEEAKLKMSEVSGDRVDHKTKLEIIKQEEEAIKREHEEEERVKAQDEAKARRAEEFATAKDEAVQEPPDVVKEVAEAIRPSIVDSAPDLKPPAKEILVDKAKVMEEIAEEKEKEKEKEEISKEDLENIDHLLEAVSDEKDIILEKEVLDALKEDVSEYHEALEDLKEVVIATGGREEDLSESKAAKRLSSKVNSMIEQIESVMLDLHKEKDLLMEDIEVKEVRMKRHTSIQENEDRRMQFLMDISEKRRNVVSINDLLVGLRRLQKVGDDTKFQRIAEVLDEDKDGIIDVNDAVKVIELLGQENVKIQAEEMSKIITLLRKEEKIEKEEKEQKMKEKLEKQQLKSQEVLKDNAVDMSENPPIHDKKVSGKTSVEEDQKEQKQKQ